MTVGTAMIGDPIDQDGSPIAIATITITIKATAIMTVALFAEINPMLVANAMSVQLGRNKAKAVTGQDEMNTIIKKKKNNTLLIPGMINIRGP
jgi:hypothetical protein